MAAGGMFNFPVGTTSDFLQVTLEDDNLLEEEFETFTVELIQQGTRLATLSTTDASFEASIRDNETLTASITAESDSVAEGQLAVFRVTLTGALTVEATNVQFEALGDATSCGRLRHSLSVRSPSRQEIPPAEWERCKSRQDSPPGS